MAQAIIRSVVDFKRDPWPKVSDSAKDLAKKLLDPDPSRRLTAKQALGSACLLTPDVLYIALSYLSLQPMRMMVLRVNFDMFSNLNAEHPWLQNINKTPNVSLGETVKARLKQFSMMNKLKKKALKVLQSSLCASSLQLFIKLTKHINIGTIIYVIGCYILRLYLSTCLWRK